MSFRKDILAACTVGDLAWLQRSIAGTTPNLGTILNKQGQNALHLATMHGRFDCVKYLLDHCGIDVNEQSSDARSTALHHCVSEGSGASSIQCLKILLERGAKHSIKDADGQTVLHYAAKVGNIKCVKLLLEHGADIVVKDDGGNTPYDLASLYGHHECVRLLRALHWARKKDNIERKNIDAQALHRARERESSALKTRLQGEAACDAYTRWMRRKNLPINRDADRMSESSCKETRPQSCGACASALTSRCLGNETLATPIKISHQQEEKNIRSVGKPEELFPYSNYPPRQTVPQRKKLCITPRSQSASLGTRASKRTEHSRSAPPLRTNSNVPVATINAMKPYAEVVGEVSPLNEPQGDKQGDNEDDGDTLFHDVDQVDEFRSSTLPRFSSGKQLTQLLQLISSRTIPGTKSTDSLPLSQFHASKRHAKYRSQFHRRFSLGAIPEGRVVDVKNIAATDMDEVELEGWNVWGAAQGSSNEARETSDEEPKNIINGGPQVTINPLVALSNEGDDKISRHKPPLALAIVNFTWEEGRNGVCTEPVLSPLMPHPLPEHQLRSSSKKPLSRRPSTVISSQTASRRTSLLPRSAPPNRARTVLNSELPSSLSFGGLASKSMIISDCVDDDTVQQHCDVAADITSDAQQCIKPVTFVFGGGLIHT